MWKPRIVRVANRREGLPFYWDVSSGPPNKWGLGAHQDDRARYLDALRFCFQRNLKALQQYGNR